MPEIPSWDNLWKKLLSNEQINAKIKRLDALDLKFGFGEQHTYNLCKEIYSDYSLLIKDEKNLLTELKNELNDLFNDFSYVYSVTARVKEINSLIQKIILRRDKYYANTVIGEKYKNLTKDTYKRVITDLVGVRVTVRNTEEFRTFDNDLKQIFPLRATDYEYGKIYPHEEKPFIAEYPVFKHPKYETDKVDEYKDIFHLEPQKSGYRSVHYTLSKNEVYIELQLRTIIDDGYSEINHEFVYKNENHPYYKVLNRLSDVLRMLSSASNDLSSLISKIHHDYLNEKQLDNQFKFLHNENKCINEIKNSISHISLMLDEFDTEEI